jgi:opacity protein-like surface antigen
MTSTARLCVVLTFCWLVAGTISTMAQQQSQGRVVRDGAAIWRLDVSVMAATVRAGTTLEITGQSDQWYEVVIPDALGGRGERGLIARSQVQLDPGSPEPPAKRLRGNVPLGSQRTQRAVAPVQPMRPARPAFPKAFVGLGGGYQHTANSFTDSVTFQQNAEDGHFDTAYTVARAPSLSVAVGAMITPVVGIGVTATRFARATPGAFSAAIPHPFFFNAPRTVGAQLSGLEREELGLHGQVRAVWGIRARVQVAAFGGPSLFRVTQDVVVDFASTENYPFDTVTFQSALVERGRKTQIGFNAGGEAAVFLTHNVGAGVTTTFARGDVDITAGDRTTRVRAGGVTTNVGLRLRF